MRMRGPISKTGGAREGSARDGGACWRAQAAKSVRRHARSAKPVRRQGMPDAPEEGREGASGRGLAGRVVQGEGDVRLGHAEPKGKEGEGRSACPSRDRRRCSSFPIPAQRGGVRLMHAEGIVARGRSASSEGAPSQRRQTGQRGTPETPTAAAEVPALATGMPLAAEGLPPTCDAPAGCAASAFATAAAHHHASPPGTARAPGRGRSALRRALSTAGTRSIPAGRSAP